MPSFELEHRYADQLVAGVDEAGCGPWAGPVVAAVAVWHAPKEAQETIKLIDDSKKLSKAKREKIFAQLMSLPSAVLECGIGESSVIEIDAMNIGHATRLAMQRAVSQLTCHPDVILVDGIRKPDMDSQVMTVIKGDQVSNSIATASIIAKVTRDQIMQQLAEQFPQYGWGKNSGYGTAQHQEALSLHGVTEHHRRSYAPIARLLSASGGMAD